jgi:hypothetical protein
LDALEGSTAMSGKVALEVARGKLESQWTWLTAAEAREVATALLEAADDADLEAKL